MKKLISFTLLSVTLSVFTVALAIPPDHANNAEILEPVSCSFYAIVEPGPGITSYFPGGYGLLITNLSADDGSLLVTYSGNESKIGNLRLKCHAEIEEGEAYQGVDAFTLEPVTGVIAPYDESCDAAKLTNSGVCKGNGTFILKGQRLQANCSILGIPTQDWQQVTTKSGKTSKICRAKSTESLPQVEPLTTPADGSIDVARTSWITLHFPDALPSTHLLNSALECDSTNYEFSADWVGAELLVINPREELPALSTCTVTWRHPISSGSTSFVVATTGVPAILAYDRDDDSTLAPFPDDVWLVEVGDTATGYKVELPVPNREFDARLFYDAMIEVMGNPDGYSPIVPLVIPVPGVMDTSSLPTTPEQSIDPLGTVGLFMAQPDVAGLGARVPFYLLQRDEVNNEGTLEHNLIIFPTQLLNPGQRYVFVITRRAFIDVSRPLEPSSFFNAASNGELVNGSEAGRKVGEILEEVLPLLEEHTSPPLYKDDIALAMQFTVRSTDEFPNDPLSIRAQLQELPLPTYTINSIKPVYTVPPPGSGLEPEVTGGAIVEGTWNAPTFRDGLYVARNSSGLPEYNDTESIPFTLALPVAAADDPVPITMYQHGSPGSAEIEVPVQAFEGFFDLGNAVIGFTDITNRELIPNGGIAAPLFAVLDAVVFDRRVPEFLWRLPLAEQLAFLRFISGLGDLDVLPIGEPDGVPDLDVTAPLTYLGISDGSNIGTALVAYAPEIHAAQLIAGGGYASGILVHQQSDLLYFFTNLLFGFNHTDLYINLSILQMGYDPQDPVNHSKYIYRAPHDLEDSNRASLLVTAGLADSFVPPYSTETAAWGFGIPHMEPIHSIAPSLEVVPGPVVSGNIDANTTGSYYQYVPVGVDGVLPTPGCEAINEANGHFCAQISSEAKMQKVEFFRSSIEEFAPNIIDPLSNYR